MTYNILIQK